MQIFFQIKKLLKILVFLLATTPSYRTTFKTLWNTRSTLGKIQAKDRKNPLSIRRSYKFLGEKRGYNLSYSQ